MPPESAVAEQTPPTTAKELSDALLAQIQKGQTELAEKTSKRLDEEVAKIREEFEKNFARYRVVGLDKPDDIEKFSFAKLISGMATKNFANCQYEVDLCREAAATVGKDMSTTVDSAGGFIVPVQVMTAKLIPLLQARIIAFELGVQDLSGLSGSPVQIPKVTGGSSAQWITENSGATKQDIAFGQLELTPHLVAALTQISLRLANLSSPAAEKIVTGQIAKDLGLAVDAAIFNGSGGAGQPTGVLQTVGIGTVSSFGSAAASTAYNKMIDMIAMLMNANALTPGAGWALDPTTWSKLQKQLDPTDNSQPKARRLFDAMPFGDSLLGYKHRESTQLPANTICLADWSQVVLGRWGTMILRSSDQAGTAFQNFQVWIQGGLEVDVGVMQPTAVVNALSVS